MKIRISVEISENKKNFYTTIKLDNDVELTSFTEVSLESISEKNYPNKTIPIVNPNRFTIKKIYHYDSDSKWGYSPREEIFWEGMEKDYECIFKVFYFVKAKDFESTFIDFSKKDNDVEIHHAPDLLTSLDLPRWANAWATIVKK